MTEYLAVVEREGESWGAYCPDLPGLGVVGDSRDEVEMLVREAVPFHIEGLRASGDPVPEPAATGAVLVEIA